MSGAVATIEALIGDTCARLFPGGGALPPLRPLAELERGDLVFDGCLVLGARLKRAPEALAAELVAALGEVPQCEFIPVEGYVNIRLRRDEDLLGAWTVPRHEPLPRRIVVAPRTGAVSRSAFGRLAASALVQAVLARRLGGDTELAVGEEVCAGELRSLADLERAAAFFECRGVAPVATGGKALERMIASADGGALPMTVWLPPSFFERDEFRVFFTRYFGSGSGRTLCSPARGWCEGFQEEWGVLPTSRGGRLGAHLLHLAGARCPEELDPAVAALDEQGNIPWFLASTEARLRRLVGGRGADAQINEPLDPVLRRLVVRVATVRYFEWAAATRGEIVQWLEVVSDLLRGANRVVNAPGYRRALALDGGTNGTTKILSGALKAVSDTMQSNPLFYEMGAL